ncbi:MAG: DUF1015 domain-containing protein [Acutalibacteraceae bacterium]|nr:DUF1015 domain-containing protein [Acutalibacteraceae bacterium]
MAQIKPFKALRFTDKAGDIKNLCCPPYDIISDKQRLEYLNKNENNIIRLELPKDGENVYKTASEVLKKFLDNQILKCDDKDAIYIYSEKFSVEDKEYEFKGIISRVHLEEFSKGIVLPHEETLSKAKQDRFELMKATMCNFSQIYSLYNDENDCTNSLVEECSASAPEISFEADGVTHSLWVVTDEDVIGKIQKQFENRKLYIADGHHRYETAVNFRDYLREQNMAKEGDECDYVMMMLVPMAHKGLVVLPTHRIVHHLDNFDCNKVIENSKDSFSIEEIDKESVLSTLKAKYEQNEKSFVMYADNKNYLFTLKDTKTLDEMSAGKSDALKNLDVNILHSLVLERVLKIDKENMAKQINLSYTRDYDEAISEVDSNNANCAFIMNPTKVSEIGDVALAGEKMPQKSTYFYPKLITGLVMNKFN